MTKVKARPIVREQPRARLVHITTQRCTHCGGLMAWHRALAVIWCVNSACKLFGKHYVVAVAANPS